MPNNEKQRNRRLAVTLFDIVSNHRLDEKSAVQTKALLFYSDASLIMNV